MEDEIASEEVKAEVEESAEMQDKDAGCETSGDVADSGDVKKTEQEEKKNYVPLPRYAPHTIPDWHFEEMRERWMWNLRIYPIHQDDCKNCILETATKIAQESWYYVPKHENGLGQAELSMLCTNKMTSVMSRIITLPFYYRYITIELTRRSNEEGEPNAAPAVYKNIMETATIVFDSTKYEAIRSLDMSKGPMKKRRLWVRYLSENTTPEILRVLFPLSQSTEVQPHDNLWIGMVETRSRADVQIFTKSYVTLIINGKMILSLQDKKRGDNEKDSQARLEKAVTPLENREKAPIEIVDRSEQYENKISRSLKRTLNHQQHTIDTRRNRNNINRGRQEPPAKRRAIRNRRDSSRSSGGRFGGGNSGYRFPGAHSSFGDYFSPEDVAAEMMLMQAELNHTLQNQLMMLSPSGGGSEIGHYSGGGDFRRGDYGGGGDFHRGDYGGGDFHRGDYGGGGDFHRGDYGGGGDFRREDYGGGSRKYFGGGW